MFVLFGDIMVFDVGRVCVKTHGRNAGKYVVVVKGIEDGFVEITGPKDVNGIKRKRSNVRHLIPTSKKLNISEKASDDEIKKELEKMKLLETFKNKVKINV